MLLTALHLCVCACLASAPWSLYQARFLSVSACAFNGCTNFTNVQYFNMRAAGNQLLFSAPMADANRALPRTTVDINYTRIDCTPVMFPLLQTLVADGI